MKWYYIALFAASVLGIFQVAQIGNFGFPPIELLFIGFWLYLPLHLFVAGKPLRVPVNLENVALVAFVAIMMLSCFGVVFRGEHGLHQQVIKTTLHSVFIFGVVFLHGHVRWTSEMIYGILRFYLSLGIVLSMYAMYQVPARILDWPFGWIEITNASFQGDAEFATGVSQLALRFADFYRATSVYPEPSALGFASAVQIVVALVPIIRRSRSILRTKWALILSLTTSILALFLAFSMTGILVMGCCLAVMVLRYPQRVLSRLLPIVGATAIGIAAIDIAASSLVKVSIVGMFGVRIESYLTGSAFNEELGTISGESATQRYGDAKVALEVWSESPIVGYGPGCFRHHQRGRMHDSDFPSSSFVMVLADYGLVGLLGYLVLLGSFVLTTFTFERRWSQAGMRDRYPDQDTIVALAPVIMVAFVVVNLSGNTVINPVYWLQFVVFVAALQFSRKAFGMYNEVVLYGRRPSASNKLEVNREGKTP